MNDHGRPFYACTRTSNTKASVAEAIWLHIRYVGNEIEIDKIANLFPLEIKIVSNVRNNYGRNCYSVCTWSDACPAGRISEQTATGHCGKPS